MKQKARETIGDPITDNIPKMKYLHVFQTINLQESSPRSWAVASSQLFSPLVKPLRAYCFFASFLINMDEPLAVNVPFPVVILDCGSICSAVGVGAGRVNVFGFRVYQTLVMMLSVVAPDLRGLIGRLGRL